MQKWLWSPLIALAFVSCGKDRLAEVPAGLDAQPKEISFGEVVVGQRAERRVRVEGTRAMAGAYVRALEQPAGFFVTPPEFTLDSGGNATIEVGFAPVQPGPAQGTISLWSDGGRTELRVDGTGIRTGLQVAPELDFGGVEVDTERTLLLEVTSESDVALQVTLPRPSDRNFVAEPATFELSPFETRSIQVTFTPRSRGATSRDLVLEVCPGCQEYEVALRGTGIVRALEAHPSTLVFDAVQLGFTRKRAVTLVNAGDLDVDLGEVVWDGEAYQVDAGGLPAVLAAGAQAAFEVSFAPLNQGMHQGRVHVHDRQNVRLLTIPLSGWTGGPLLAVSPASVDFGSLIIGWDPFPTETVRLTNIGDPDPVDLLSATIEGPDADAFHVYFAGPSPIDPHAEVQVEFRPNRGGDHVAMLTLQTSAQEQATFAIRLVGESLMLGPCNLEIRPGEQFPRDDGAYEIGQDDKIRIRHKEGPPCVVSNFRFEGPDADWYRIIHLELQASGDNLCGFSSGNDRFKPPQTLALLEADSVCNSHIYVDIHPIAPTPRPLHAAFRFEVNGDTRSIDVMTSACGLCAE